MEDQPALVAQDTQNTQETQGAPEAQDMDSNQMVSLFIDAIMEEKGVDTPTDEIRANLHDNLQNELLTQIDRALVAELPDDKLDELSQMAEANNGVLDPNVVADAIENANLDTGDIVRTVMERFRELYLHPETAMTEAPDPLNAQSEAPLDDPVAPDFSQPEPNFEEQGA